LECDSGGVDNPEESTRIDARHRRQHDSEPRSDIGGGDNLEQSTRIDFWHGDALGQEPQHIEVMPLESEHVQDGYLLDISLGDDNADPVAEIGPEEAAIISTERWASWIQHTRGVAIQQVTEPRNTGRVVVLSFNRHPPEWRDAIISSRPATRAASCGAELEPIWAGGAKILVPGLGPEFFDFELGAHQVVVREEDEDAVHEVLLTLPYRLRKPKRGTERQVVPDQISLLAISSDSVVCSTDSSDSHTCPGNVHDGAMPILTIRRTCLELSFPAPETMSARTV